LAASTLMACGAGDVSQFDAADEGGYSEEMELGELDQGIFNCSNLDGTNSVMAALAVAAGHDLGRWRAGLDFYVAGDRIALQSGTGPDGKPRGLSRCGGNCRRIAPLLALQSDSATNVYIANSTNTSKVLLNPGALRSRMKAKLEEQINKDVNAKDGDIYNVPKTPHTLSGAGITSLGGCGPHYKFNVVFDATSTTPKPVQGQLKNSLYFADQANGWVDFKEVSPGVVAIDPTYGLNEEDTSSAGSCTAACTKVSTAASLTGQCCSCAGVTKAFKVSPFSASIFLCQ
jgi:hypothetical protein